MTNWKKHNPTFDFDKANKIIRDESAWSGHFDFAYDLVRFMQPKVIVELGSHLGGSFFSFCQGIKDSNLQTKCYAIDTWEDDNHRNFTGEEAHWVIDQVTKSYYPHQGTLIKSTSKAAVYQFEDESIDLLHIDGLHTYEAALNDYETWLPKLAPHGIVLFHDIAVLDQGFEIYQLWNELREQFPHFEFHHSAGLGVLFPKGVDASFSAILKDKEELQHLYTTPLVSAQQEYGISVIIPTYKGEDAIGRMLDSILNQTFKNFEIIIVNDGSPDQTQAILDEYIKKHANIRVFWQENQGIVRAKARGVQEVRGNYVLIVDQDDWLEPNALEKLYFRAIADQADMVYYGFYEVYGEVKHHYPPRNDVNYFHLNYYPLWSKLIKTDYLKLVKYDELPAISQIEDSLVSFLLGVFQPKISILNESLYYYNQPESSSKHNLSLNDHYASDAIASHRYLTARFKELGIYEKYHGQLLYYLNDLKNGIDQHGNEKVKAQFAAFHEEISYKMNNEQPGVIQSISNEKRMDIEQVKKINLLLPWWLKMKPVVS